jgi:hypothetical protein
VGFLVVDEGLDPIAAVRESWRRTEGLAGRILLLWFLGIPITLAGLCSSAWASCRRSCGSTWRSPVLREA